MKLKTGWFNQYFIKKNKNMEYNWGPTDEITKSLLTKELFEDKIYTIYQPVNKGDIVVDIGASTGIFTFSILENKPKHVFCFEPSKTEFPALVSNTIGSPVTQINKAIGPGDGLTSESITVFYDSGLFETIKFSSFVELYSIDRINFLKTDCEGGEYYIFTEDNIEWILKNVDFVVGEWHLESSIDKFRFRDFRDNYLRKFRDFKVLSVDGIDIKWDLYNEHFIDYYKQVIFHIWVS